MGPRVPLLVVVRDRSDRRELEEVLGVSTGRSRRRRARRADPAAWRTEAARRRAERAKARDAQGSLLDPIEGRGNVVPLRPKGSL